MTHISYWPHRINYFCKSPRLSTNVSPRTNPEIDSGWRSVWTLNLHAKVENDRWTEWQFFWGGRTGASVCSYDVSIPPFSKKLSPRARQAIFSEPKSYLLKPSKLSSFFTPFLTLGERHMIRQITADRYYHDTIRNADTETRHNEVNNLYKTQNIFKDIINGQM